MELDSTLESILHQNSISFDNFCSFVSKGAHFVYRKCKSLDGKVS